MRGLIVFFNITTWFVLVYLCIIVVLLLMMLHYYLFTVVTKDLIDNYNGQNEGARQYGYCTLY